MLHLTTLVSRKTAHDGRLEIPESLAGRLASVDATLVVSVLGDESPARLEEMACTCPKGAGAGHHHHFLAADSLRSLPAGASVNLEVDVDEGRIGIELN